MIVEEVVIDRDNNVNITLAIPIDDNSSEPGSSEPGSPEPGSPEPESVAIASTEDLVRALGLEDSDCCGLCAGESNRLAALIR